MDFNVLEQIGRVSKKIFFTYNLNTSRFDFLSQAIERVWEVELKIIHQNTRVLLNILHPDDLPLAIKCFRELQHGTANEFVCRLVFPEASSKVVSIDAYPVVDENGQVAAIAGIAEDITVEEEYEAYLIEFTRRKNTALEIVAHDLRGPLAIVKSVSDAMEKDARELNYEEISTFTRFINKACETCINLIADLLSDEHLKSPTISVKKERVDIIHKINEAASSYFFSGGIQNMFEIETEEDKLFIEVDIVKFDQIINNLISNAIKFTAPNGKINIRVKKENEYVMILFSDNGIGIPEELKPFIFDRYTKASRPGLKGEKSKGIGLSIVRDLVEVQGGHIQFESEENKGTTFYITLPLK